MKTYIIEPDFSEFEAEVLVIGVSGASGKYGRMESIRRFISVHAFPEWVKSGDIKTDFKEIVKMPAFNERGYKRVFFIGLGAQKH